MRERSNKTNKSNRIVSHFNNHGDVLSALNPVSGYLDKSGLCFYYAGWINSFL